MARPYLAAVGLILVAHGTYAWADNPVQDIARAPTSPASSTSPTPEYLKKFEGSSAEASTYIGSGSFYASGYHNPYASIALFVKPSYSLGTRYRLALRARIYVEEEFTSPDTANGRRFYPYDPWVWLSADNLHKFERSKIRIGGAVRTIFPLSYESRYQNMLFAIGGGPNVNRDFEFGQVSDPKRKWTLKLTWALMAMKYFQSSPYRGSGPGDRTGCLAPSGAGAAGVSSGGGGAGSAGSEGDHCGGPANTNYAIGNSLLGILGHGDWSLMMSVYLANTFKYAFPADAMTADNGALTGQSDTSWGIIALSYELRPRISLSAGISSLQPALDSRYRYPRFPFWDFAGGNMNNYSQVFFSVGGTL
jgi:hypothetical protein